MSLSMNMDMSWKDLSLAYLGRPVQSFKFGSQFFPWTPLGGPSSKVIVSDMVSWPNQTYATWLFVESTSCKLHSSLRFLVNGGCSSTIIVLICVWVMRLERTFPGGSLPHSSPPHHTPPHHVPPHPTIPHPTLDSALVIFSSRAYRLGKGFLFKMAMSDSITYAPIKTNPISFF